MPPGEIKILQQHKTAAQKHLQRPKWMVMLHRLAIRITSHVVTWC